MIGSSHQLRNPDGNGTLSDGSFKVTLDGVTLDPATVPDLFYAFDYVLEVSVDGDDVTPFRGHLVRLGEDSTGVQPLSFEDIVNGKEAPGCSRAVGFTHQNNFEKQSASATMRWTASVGNQVPLDVTVVVRNCASSSQAPVEACDPTESTYYYSRFLLNFSKSAPAPPPTNLPTPPPVSGETTAAPALPPAAPTPTPPTGGSTTSASAILSLFKATVLLWVGTAGYLVCS